VYPLALTLHSALRWVVLGAGVWAVARPASGWFAGRPWGAPDVRAARRFATALDAQVTLGLLLYGVLSPVTRAAFGAAGGALRRAPEVRFFVVQHLACMLAALVLAHVGAVAARRASADGSDPPARVRHRRALTWAALALAAVAAGVPWWRPLYRAFG
jgi:hypothetical protein